MDSTWADYRSTTKPGLTLEHRRRRDVEGHNMANFLLHPSRLSQPLDLESCPCKIKLPEGCFNHADCQWSQAIVPVAGGAVPW